MIAAQTAFVVSIAAAILCLSIFAGWQAHRLISSGIHADITSQIRLAALVFSLPTIAALAFYALAKIFPNVAYGATLWVTSVVGNDTNKAHALLTVTSLIGAVLCLIGIVSIFPFVREKVRPVVKWYMVVGMYTMALSFPALLMVAITHL